MRVAVITDVHSNLVAMQACLADAGDFDDVWCLGDLVGYGPNPNECIDLLRRYRHVCVAGNHDWAAIGKLPVDEFNSDAASAALWTRNQLSPDSLSYLQGLPTGETRGDWTLVHGSPRSPVWEYILSIDHAMANFPHFTTAYCLIGHSHLPLIFSLKDEEGAMCKLTHPTANSRWRLGRERLIVNPGSVGQPRDGVPEAAYALLDTQSGLLDFRRVAYDIGKTQARMRKVGLPTRLWARLSYGW